MNAEPFALAAIALCGFTFLGKSTGPLLANVTVTPFPNVSTSSLLTPACYKYNHGRSQCTKDSDCCSGMCRQKLGQGSYCLHR
jgi:hypothetical protein